MTQGAIKALRRIQIGKENPVGTEADATARLLGDGFLVDQAEVVRPERDYGNLAGAQEVPVAVLTASALDFSTDLSFEQILYALHAGIEGGVSPSEQHGGEGDQLWTFSSPVASDPGVNAFTLEGMAYDGSSYIEQLTAVYAVVTELGISAAFGANLSEHTASWIARAAQAKAPTGDPGIPLRTLIPADKWGVKLADTQAGLAGASILAGIVNSFDLSIVTGIGVKHRLNASLDHAGKIFGVHTATLTINSDLIAAIETERTKFRTPAARFIRLEVEGSQIGAGDNHRIQFDMAAHILEPPTVGDEDGQETREITYVSMYDPTFTKAFEFQVTNTLAALP